MAEMVPVWKLLALLLHIELITCWYRYSILLKRFKHDIVQHFAHLFEIRSQDFLCSLNIICWNLYNSIQQSQYASSIWTMRSNQVVLTMIFAVLYVLRYHKLICSPASGWEMDRTIPHLSRLEPPKLTWITRMGTESSSWKIDSSSNRSKICLSANTDMPSLVAV